MTIRNQAEGPSHPAGRGGKPAGQQAAQQQLGQEQQAGQK